jgi:hypothetical protein
MLLVTALGSLSGTGCLIAEAPDYGAPRRTTPVVDQSKITPAPIFPIKTRLGDSPQHFIMTVRSEDAGEALYAVPVLNKGGGDEREQILLPRDVPARAADEPKNIDIDLPLEALLSTGCHTVTIMVMHTSSFQVSRGLPFETAVDDDVASVTWWVDAQTRIINEIQPCPTPGGM